MFLVTIEGSDNTVQDAIGAFVCDACQYTIRTHMKRSAIGSIQLLNGWWTEPVLVSPRHFCPGCGATRFKSAS